MTTGVIVDSSRQSTVMPTSRASGLLVTSQIIRSEQAAPF
jgi:hypothetical protein